MLFKYMIVSLIIIVNLISFGVSSEVLELGESKLHGKKDQPEAMTFVSRAPLDLEAKAIKLKLSDEIRKEINNTKLFDLVYH